MNHMNKYMINISVDKYVLITPLKIVVPNTLDPNDASINQENNKNYPFTK
jgi:hypothetical protein